MRKNIRNVKVNRYKYRVNLHSRKSGVGSFNIKGFLAVAVHAAVFSCFGLGLFFFGLKVHKYMSTDPSFNIKTITIQNNITVSEQEILSNLQICKGMNIFSVNVDSCLKRLSLLPNIKYASIQKRYPDEVVIRVSERTAIFQFFSGCYFFVDDEGVVLAKMSRQPDPSLPIVRGVLIPEVSFGSKMEQKQLALALSAVDSFNKSSLKNSIQIQEFDISNSENVVLIMNTGSSVSLGDDEFDYRFKKLSVIMNDLKHKNMNFQSIDLRFENVPVLLRNI